MGEIPAGASTAEKFAEKFESFAEVLTKQPEGYSSEASTYQIGKAIHHAWLCELLTPATAIQRIVQGVVDNPPPAETKETRSWAARASRRSLRSRPAMMMEAIYAAVFDLLHSMGEIEGGRVGSQQLCRRLAEIVTPAPVVRWEAGGTETEVPVGLDSLTLATKRAWGSWKLAEANYAETPQDRIAYDWLTGQPDETFIGELVGYELPAFDTWQRYVREARRAVGENKNLPRVGRAAGASVVKRDEI